MWKREAVEERALEDVTEAEAESVKAGAAYADV